MTITEYVTDLTGGVLSLEDDTPSLTDEATLEYDEYFAFMFYTEYFSFHRNYKVFRGKKNFNVDLDCHDIDIWKKDLDTGYYISKYYNKLYLQNKGKGRVIKVKFTDYSECVLLDEGALGDTTVTITAVTATTLNIAWSYIPNALGYIIDISTDNFQTYVSSYEAYYIGNVLSLSLTSLNPGQLHYIRVKGYNSNYTGNYSPVTTQLTTPGTLTDFDGNTYHYVTIGTQQWMVENFRSEHYADGTAIPNIINGVDDWFLPSQDELLEMYNELYLFGVGGFINTYYWSSSEDSLTDAWGIQFNTGVITIASKPFLMRVRACRSFNSTTVYSLRDTGPSGGLIFWKSGDDYLEAAPLDETVTNIWSNLNLLVGTTGTAIGTGQANTTAIIAQVGHTDSAAKLCNDLSVDGWINDTAGAMCYYDNDEATYKADYGALYNWYAVDNAHGLAPTGWRVPSEDDWDALYMFLSEIESSYLIPNVGQYLKKVGTDRWNSPNIQIDDRYGFTAVGGGYRGVGGEYTS